MLRPTRVRTHVLNRYFAFSVDKTKKNVLKYSDIAANYLYKLIQERTWLESWIVVLKKWSG